MNNNTTWVEMVFGNKPFYNYKNVERWGKAWESNVRDDYDSSEMDRWGKVKWKESLWH